MVLPQIENLRARGNDIGPVIFLLDGHSTHVTERVVAFAGSERILIIRLLPHSSRFSQPLDLYMFGLFKTLYKKSKKLKEETLKIYRALHASYKTRIIPMVR
jgi:hypothetical protein